MCYLRCLLPSRLPLPVLSHHVADLPVCGTGCLKDAHIYFSHLWGDLSAHSRLLPGPLCTKCPWCEQHLGKRCLLMDEHGTQSLREVTCFPFAVLMGTIFSILLVTVILMAFCVYKPIRRR